MLTKRVQRLLLLVSLSAYEYNGLSCIELKAMTVSIAHNISHDSWHINSIQFNSIQFKDFSVHKTLH